AAGEGLPLEDDGEDDLSEGEREHREVGLREADNEKAEEERARRRGQGREGQRDQHRKSRTLHEDSCRVRAEREVRGVAEGDHATEAHEEVEGGGEESDDRDLGQELEEERWQEEGRQRERGGQEPEPGDGVHHYSSGLPRSPQGRTMRTIAIRAKRSTIEMVGKIRMPKDCNCPTRSALMKLPAKLPRPPITTTTKAVVSTSPSMPSATATVRA